MTLGKFVFYAALAAAAFCAPASAQTPDWKTEWNRTLAAAQAQKLRLVVHPDAVWKLMGEDFQKRYPGIKVEITVMSPNKFAPRVITEQRGGIYAWDSWLAPTSNMTQLVEPLGGIAPIGGYLILPEVKDIGQWRSAKYIYASAKPNIFLFSIIKTQTIFLNQNGLRGTPIRTEDDLLNPKLKGRMVLRDPQRPNSGAFVIASLMKNKGEAFARRLIVEQKPRIMDNPRQVTDAVMRGSTDIVLGGEVDILASCISAGGCGHVKRAEFGGYLLARGVAVLKNPPDKDAVKVWVNWLLSREGQIVFEKITAATSVEGAVSMRKDVAPVKQSFDSEPDYTTLDKQLILGHDSARPFVERTNQMMAEIRAKGR